MATEGAQHPRRTVWELAGAQHGVLTRSQLLGLGVHPSTIERRVRQGRLHRVHRGVYALGRPHLDRFGRWMAAVLACGPGSVLSHASAAALWGLAPWSGGPVDVSAPSLSRRRAGIHLRRRALQDADRRRRAGIPVASVSLTLVDLASVLPPARLERAVNDADKLDLVDPEALRSDIERLAGVPGVPAVRELLDHRTFRLTDSELERRFLGLVRRAGLPLPETGRHVNGFKVDFFWPELGLVVETDGLRYHRTPAQQARDRLRDQAHLRRGLTSIRFTHQQVKFDPLHVVETLREIVGGSETRPPRAG